MKTILFFASAAFALSTAAAMAGDQFAGMYGNTLHVKDSDGRESTLLINQDHTWTQTMSDGSPGRGTYEWTDEAHFCATVIEPAPKPGEQPHKDCFEMSGDHKPGDTWTMKSEDGASLSMSITAGR